MSLLSYVSLLWLSYISMANGSAGDRNPVFIDCLDSCVEKLCKLRYDGGKWFPAQQTSSTLEERRQVRRRLHQHLETNYLQHPPLASPSTATRVTLDHLEKEEWEGEGGEESERVERYTFSRPWYLAVMGWDCYSECKYSCMTMHVETRIEAGERVQQYYGKWPFRRVWGIQELFSSLFSAGNGLPHLYHLLFSRGQYNPPGNYMRFWLTLYPWMGINTWVWSTVFHARDLRWTEAADYFCALLNIFFVVWVAIVRTAGPAWKRRPGVHGLVCLIGVSMSIYYVLHVGFMWFVKFDYGYNMKVALLAGLVHTTLWLLYHYRIRERSYAVRGAVSMVLLNAAILLEVGDFSPVAYRLLDAHAIWHGVTIPLVFSWYRFVIQDARYEVSVNKTF